ncbi:hypothetical protein SCALM49S_09182 [Streptomyces californicus]
MRTSQLAASSSRRGRAGDGRRVVPGFTRLDTSSSPQPPSVQVTSTVRTPSAAYRARTPPVPVASSSGWACTAMSVNGRSVITQSSIQVRRFRGPGGRTAGRGPDDGGQGRGDRAAPGGPRRRRVARSVQPYRPGRVFPFRDGKRRRRRPPRRPAGAATAGTVMTETGAHRTRCPRRLWRWAVTGDARATPLSSARGERHPATASGTGPLRSRGEGASPHASGRVAASSTRRRATSSGSSGLRMASTRRAQVPSSDGPREPMVRRWRSRRSSLAVGAGSRRGRPRRARGAGPRCAGGRWSVSKPTAAADAERPRRPPAAGRRRGLWPARPQHRGQVPGAGRPCGTGRCRGRRSA